ncbi:MAG TPA: pyridoxal kinase PdxY [Stellaceae bacterium]|nr:pyridoxal kinase PdxY [Stellaceae bacterium]
MQNRGMPVPAVLSIQSWVACGMVGNPAAAFTLQRLGIEAWSLNTVLFSNHTGHPGWTGHVVPADEIGALFDGIAALGRLPHLGAVLSGYLGAAETGPVLLDIVARVKRANPGALYCCDPVMGDAAAGWYAAPALREFFRDRAVPQADIVTPNRFELEWLGGRPVGSLAEAGAAIAALRRRGPNIVLVTSLDVAPDRIVMMAGGPEGVWAVETPRLPIEATGCGDTAAALFLARLLGGTALPAALAATCASIYGVIAATLKAGGGELALVAAQDELVAPSHKVEPWRL